MVIVVGAFPPPVSGAAAINAAIVEQLKADHVRHLVFDLTSKSFGAHWTETIGRTIRLIRQTARIALACRQHHGSVVYMGLAGGWGRLHNAVVTLAARLAGRPLLLHHHSFAYLERKSLLTEVLVRIGGDAAAHIMLCERMKRLLLQRYPVKHVRVISNAAFVASGDTCPVRQDGPVWTIGFMGNISRAKGISTFLRTLDTLRDQGSFVRGVIAGPFQDSAARLEVLDYVVRHKDTAYAGAVYGAAKEEFWRSLDIFVFPSEYIHEAEPLVVLEALSCGIPTIASSRGCLETMLEGGGGVAIPEINDFPQAAARQIQSWMSSERAYRQTAVDAKRWFAQTRERAYRDLRRMVTEMANL